MTNNPSQDNTCSEEVVDEIQNICIYITQKDEDMVQSHGGGFILTERKVFRLALPSMYI